ncbi:MAG: GNAT family N-acetyltransferase [Treponema sp.]|jgi:GNAT superfamily N-acetyltransferase|nr:GNAT family N-acetyltransferase [Treponema sp.]
MILRYAEMGDYGWIKDHERHIADKTLQNKIANKEVYVAQEDNTLLGWLRYNLFWDNVPFMNKIFVVEGRRKRGIGKKLLNHWEEEMKQRGYKNVLTSTQSNEDAQHFYRKMGYTEIGGIKYLDDPYELIFFKEI